MSNRDVYIVWPLRSLARLPLVLTLLLTFTLISRPAAPAAPEVSGPVCQAYYPEVRLRKLHLVRPDLIPYPIFYEVYC